jgi:hypothetical protein
MCNSFLSNSYSTITTGNKKGKQENKIFWDYLGGHGGQLNGYNKCRHKFMSPGVIKHR